MNVWILNHYADSPDRQATGHYDLGKQLVAKGHKVTIFASGFSHYKLCEDRLQSGEKFVVENQGGVNFIWLKTFPYRGNHWRRIVNMVSYAWRALLVGRKLPEKPDVIIGTCPHTFGATAAYALARLERARFFYEVRDLWPQTLVDVGALSENSPITWSLRKLEKFLFERSERILTVLPCIDAYVSSLGISESKVAVIPNGADFTRYDQMRAYDGKISGPFKVMYLGGLAKYHGVQVILHAAKSLEKMHCNEVEFVIVGDGPERRPLIESAEALGLRNVEFRPSVPKDQVGNVMGEADAFIMHIRDMPVLRYGISSNKLCDYLSSGRPVVFAVNSPNNPVQGAGAGLSIRPEDPAALAQAVLDLMALSPEQRILMGRNGVEYAKVHYDVRILAQRLEDVLLGGGTSIRVTESPSTLPDRLSCS